MKIFSHKGHEGHKGNILFVLMFLCCVLPFMGAQEFGFGDYDDGGEVSESAVASSSSKLGVALSGEVSSTLLVYDKAFIDGDVLARQNLGYLAAGRLNFAATSKYVDGFINFKVDGKNIAAGGLTALDFFDELYLRAGAGGFDIEAGLRKIVWGRADSMGPLDVVNPYDYRDLTDMSNLLPMKIARPLLHLSYRFGDFNKIEGVFVPTFQAHRFSFDGDWAPSLLGELAAFVPAGMTVADIYTDKKNRLDYAQGGARWTSTFGSADLGIQYYTGIFQRPAVSASISGAPPPYGMGIATGLNSFEYNRFHQFGVDTAFVVWGFNVRSEAAYVMTADFDGDDPKIQNPSFAYSFGFDRDLFWGINLNVQANGSVRIYSDEIVEGAYNPITGVVVDNEAEVSMTDLSVSRKPLTSTRVTGILSKRFLRDELEARVTALWGIEDKDFLIIPALIWTKDALEVEVSAGIFGGDSGGELGQYNKNSYVKAAVAYSF